MATVSTVLTILFFYFTFGFFPGPESVVPSDVTVNVDTVTNKVELVFSDIQFTSMKDRADWAFVGPDITAIDHYLRENHQLTVDINAPQFTQVVEFSCPLSTQTEGYIGGITLPYFSSSIVLSTWLPQAQRGEYCDGMKAVTVDLPVVPVSVVKRNSIEELRPQDRHEMMTRYYENVIKALSEKLAQQKK